MRLSARDRDLDLANPHIMGVLNITPDSFSDGGVLYSAQGTVDRGALLATAQQMIEQGASVLDVGGESTRPGADPIAAETELARVIPVIETLSELDVLLSIDTRKAQVANEAIAAGCHLVNDISAAADPDMLRVVAESGAALCLMHMQGDPQTMQQAPRYWDTVAEVNGFFAERVAAANAAGVPGERLLLDPGFGFGKRLEHNVTLLRGLAEFKRHGLPVLVGASRKSMLGLITGRSVGERLAGSLAFVLLAVQNGASIVRVHDVAETADVLKVLQVLEAQALEPKTQQNENESKG